LLLAALIAGPAACGFGDTTDQDGTSPVVVITKPEGTTVEATVDFAATVIDEGGVQVVEFIVNDVTIGTDFVEPYEVRWNTIGTGDGPALLKVVAKDYAGNQAVITKNVTVQNAPN
jgi:hypothetical protein